MEKTARRVLSIIVVNEASVLSRITDLFSGRGYNIVSLTVAPIPQTHYSRLTIVTLGSVRVIEQITKQLHKLIPVFKVIEHSDLVEKEMVLVKFPLQSHLSDIETLCNAYNGRVVNVGKEFIITMIADEPQRVEHFLEAVTHFSPKEIIRSGAVAIER
jgi:acetolactate synthase I/III small subunit